MMIRVTYAVLVFLLLVPATGKAATPIPSASGHSVYDLAQVIHPEHEAAMERVHTQLFQKAQVAIVVITTPQLEEETIEDFAVRVGQTWGVGKKGEDRGIVVALSVRDRKVFIATGYGVEEFLPDGRVGRMIDTYAIDSLRKNDFSTALYQLSLVLVDAAAKEYQITIVDMPPQPESAPELGFREIVFGGLMFILLLYMLWKHPRLLFLLLLSGRRGGGGFGGGGFGGGFGGGGFGGGGGGRSF